MKGRRLHRRAVACLRSRKRARRARRAGRRDRRIRRRAEQPRALGGTPHQEADARPPKTCPLDQGMTMGGELKPAAAPERRALHAVPGRRRSPRRHQEPARQEIGQPLAPIRMSSQPCGVTLTRLAGARELRSWSRTRTALRARDDRARRELVEVVDRCLRPFAQVRRSPLPGAALPAPVEHALARQRGQGADHGQARVDHHRLALRRAVAVELFVALVEALAQLSPSAADRRARGPAAAR